MSPFYELVKKIRSYLTLSQKVNGIVSALEELEKSSAPFSRITEGFTTPAPGFIANVRVTNTDWILRGQRLICGQSGAGGGVIAYFIVDEVVDSTTVILRRSPQDTGAAGAFAEAGCILTPGVPDVAWLGEGKADLSSTTGRVRIAQAPAAATELPESEFNALLADPTNIGNRYQPGHIIYTGHDGDHMPVSSFSTTGLGTERVVIGAHDFEVGERIVATKSNGTEVQGVVVGIEPTAITWELLIEEL